jgi:hypothetical protein
MRTKRIRSECLGLRNQSIAITPRHRDHFLRGTGRDNELHRSLSLTAMPGSSPGVAVIFRSTLIALAADHFAMSAAQTERRRQRGPAASFPVSQAAGLVAVPAPIPVIRTIEAEMTFAPIPVVRTMEALPAKAVEEAPRIGRLRGRNPDEQGHRREGAKNEFHCVPPLAIAVKETVLCHKKSHRY